MDLTRDDMQRLAWARVNWTLEQYGDGPQYRAAWAQWQALAFPNGLPGR